MEKKATRKEQKRGFVDFRSPSSERRTHEETKELADGGISDRTLVALLEMIALVLGRDREATIRPSERLV